MTDLKFRVWNGEKMVYDVTVGKFGAFYVNPGSKGNGLDENDSASISTFNTRYPNTTPVMQFTGLHDKNEKEIFEGDFFQRPVKINKSLHGEWTIYQFMIKNGNTIISYLRSEKDTGIPEGYMAALYTDELDIDMKTLMFAKEVTLHEVEILGNIHEHKHLLK